MYKELPSKLSNRDIIGKESDPTNVYRVKKQADGTYKLEIHPEAYLTQKYTVDDLRVHGFKLVT